MQNNQAVKFVPAVGANKRVDLVLEGDQAVIQLSTWSEGLGWCGQKTLSLDADMLDEMHKLISAARIRINGKKSLKTDIPQSHRILKFPNI